MLGVVSDDDDNRFGVTTAGKVMLTDLVQSERFKCLPCLSTGLSIPPWLLSFPLA